LFLLHAPLSQRGFYFFDCLDVGGRFFLQADFSIQCFTTKHETFVPIAMGFLVFFSFLFPLLVLFQLCRHRKNLHSPEIRHKFGFLYRSFNVGGEYWEIHEVFRKMILTGLLVFIPGNSRAAVAILVSVMSVATLNYVKPHKNYLVFWVAQGSFLITTFKYLSVILLSSDLDDLDTGTSINKAQDVIGTILIVLDMIFMVVSFFTLFAVVLVLRSVLKADKTNGTQIVPNGGENKILPVASLWRSFNHVKALEHAKVEKTEVDTQRAHDAAMKVVEEHRAVAHMRLVSRIKKRKTMVSVSMVAASSTLSSGSVEKKTIAIAPQIIVIDPVVEKTREALRSKLKSLKHLNSVFKKLDTEHSGTLSKSEFSKLIRAALQQQLEIDVVDLVWKAAWKDEKHGEQEEINVQVLSNWLEFK